MYWLQRPPHLRRLGAGLLVLFALLWDLRSAATEPYPFAARTIPPGGAFTDEVIEWRSLPVGALPVPDLGAGAAAVAIGAGDPITPSMIAPAASVPEGWWAVPVDLPSRSAVGTGVMLVVVEPPMSIPGIVVATQRGDRFSLDYAPSLVAVPGDLAPLVAAAERAGMLVAATEP